MNLVTIVFEVNPLTIAYTMQLRGVKDFGVDRPRWNKLFKGICSEEDERLVRRIEGATSEECLKARGFREDVEKRWRQCEENVLAWLKEITKVDFRERIVRVCVVPFVSGETPFRDIPLMIVGKIRQGWDYPETIAHELAHILFNQNFNLQSEVEHPYVQLIEEEIAVRLGARARYFDYDVPAIAGWVRKAQQKEKAWRRYLQSIGDFEDIGQFIKKNENL